MLLCKASTRRTFLIGAFVVCGILYLQKLLCCTRQLHSSCPQKLVAAEVLYTLRGDLATHRSAELNTNLSVVLRSPEALTSSGGFPSSRCSHRWPGKYHSWQNGEALPSQIASAVLGSPGPGTPQVPLLPDSPPKMAFWGTVVASQPPIWAVGPDTGAGEAGLPCCMDHGCREVEGGHVWRWRSVGFPGCHSCPIASV